MREASPDAIAAINAATLQCANVICNNVECIVDGFAVASRLYAWLEIVLDREGGDTEAIRNEFFKAVDIQKKQISLVNQE